MTTSTSMPEKNLENVLAELMMSKSAGVAFCLLVEGDYDVRFWRGEVADEKIIVNCGGKDTLRRAVEENNIKNYIKVVGIQDRDFTDYFPEPELENTIYTDCNDMETTLLYYGGLDKIMTYMIDSAKIACLKSTNCQYPILEHVLFFGKLRILDKTNNYRIDFKELKIMRFYRDQNSFVFSKRKAFEAMAMTANKPIKEIVERYKEVRIYEFWKSVRGHDCISVLSRAKKCFHLPKIGSEKIETDLLLSFDRNAFKRGSMYTELARWENENDLSFLKVN